MPMKTETVAESIGLILVNERDFYFQYAKPLVERHALLATASNADALAETLNADWLLLAEYGADLYRFRISKAINEEAPNETPELLTGLAEYFQSHYRPAEYDPPTKPRGGDAVRSNPAWEWGSFAIKSPDDWGIIGGSPMREEGGSVTFNYSAFRGKSSKYGIGPEYVSCSGGPATIYTPPDDMTFSGEGIVVHFWRWRETPRASSGVNYKVAVPLWICDLN